MFLALDRTLPSDLEIQALRPLQRSCSLRKELGQYLSVVLSLNVPRTVGPRVGGAESPTCVALDPGPGVSLRSCLSSCLHHSHQRTPKAAYPLVMALECPGGSMVASLVEPEWIPMPCLQSTEHQTLKSSAVHCKEWECSPWR